MYNIHIEKILCVYSIKIFRSPFMNRKKGTTLCQVYFLTTGTPPSSARRVNRTASSSVSPAGARTTAARTATCIAACDLKSSLTMRSCARSRWRTLSIGMACAASFLQTAMRSCFRPSGCSAYWRLSANISRISRASPRMQRRVTSSENRPMSSSSSRKPASPCSTMAWKAETRRR